MNHKITITRVEGLETQFFVEAALANGYNAMSMRCKSEDEARVYARGLQDGFALVKNAIDLGLRFDGVIQELEKP